MMAVLRVLVGVEMHQCNRNPRHMEFSVLSLSELVKMTSECSWSDALVELQVWCQLATFCYEAEEHSLLLQSMEKALMLEEAAATSLTKKPFVLHGLAGVSELLSTVTSLKGLMIIHMSNGDLQAHKEAMKEFLSSVSYAEKAENPSLCVTAARHFWNSCLPFIHIPEERHQLQEPLEKILLALIQTRTKYVNSMQKGLFSLKALSHGCPSDNAMAEQQNLTLTAAIYIVLLHNHIDKTNWKGALELLAKAIRDTPCSRQQFVLQGHRILVKARFGENIITDMRKLQKERETNCSSLWHQAALCAVNITQQLAYYKNCITSFKSEESQWQKANVLLEFGEWLYQQNFSKDDGKQQVHLAIDILLQTESGMTGEAADNSQTKDLGSLKCKSLDGFQEWLFPQSLAHLTDVRCLDNLVRAHVLLAVMAERTSPEHQLNLLRAFTVVLQIWQVSMAPLQISPEIKKSPKPEADRSKTGKGKNVKDPSPGKDKAESLTPNQTLPTTPKGWAEYVCPELARQTFGTSRDLCCINTHSITNQTRSLYFLSLLQKELLSLSLGHLTPPILHLAEAISSELLCSRSLSDLYGLGIVKTCCHLGLETNCPYQDKLINMTGICEQELMECRKPVVLARQRKDYCNSKDFREGLLVNSRPDNKHVNTQNIWVDKAKLCVSMELYQAARELLSEASLVSVELQDHKTLAKTLLTQANLACAENKFDQALIFLDKAQALGGDENFWYQLTLTFVKAVAGQRKMDAHIQIDQIIYKGCEALKMILKRQMNRISTIKFLITSLQMRGAVQCVHVLGSDKPRETLSTKVIQALLAAYETLRECASVFTELSYREHAAEAHKECAYFLRLLANNTTDVEDKQQFLLDGLSQIQLAVSQQEHVVLNVQTLFPSQSKSQGLLLECVRQLQHLRVGLADFGLAMLGQHCAEKSRQAEAWERMTSAEKALEEFLRCAPEPNSTEEKWIGVGMTLEQLVLDQLAGVDSQSQDTETKAHCLHLRGRFFRMLAVQTDPLYLCALWDGHEKPCSDPEVSFMERRGSKVEADKASDRGKSSATSAKSVELQQQPRCRAQQLLSSASQALAEATSLCLQHKLPPTILADAALTMVECHGQWDPVLAGQYLALFQSCCAASAMADVLSCACGDTSTSQLSAVFTLHKNVLVLQKEKSSRMLKEVEDSLNKLSKSSTLLTISPNHLNILAELPSNLRILLLQHSKDGSELYGAFYEKNQHGKNVKDTGRLACSRVAKVSVCPQALQALREQCLAFSYGKSQDLHEEAGWPTDENSAIEETLESSFKRVVQHMDEYLNPLLSQFDFSSSRPQDHSLGFSELSKSAEKERNIPEPEQYVVLLADMMLMDLPLEALSILQEDSFCSVSRDFSLQLLHSRLRDQPDKAVASDTKKETKGGKKAKGKKNQSKVIKETSEKVLPSNTVPVDLRNFKYIVDVNDKGVLEETSLSMWMQQALEKHHQSTHPWTGFLGSQQKPSRSEMEQLLCTCSGLIYLGMEPFGTTIPPDKIAALNMSECRVALLFDFIVSRSRILCHSASNQGTSQSPPALEKPSETALLMSLCGVGCVVLQQWPSSLEERAQSVENVLDRLLRVKQTCGQAVHALRRGSASHAHHKVTSDEAPGTDSVEAEVVCKAAVQPSAFSCLLYGLPNLAL